MLTVSADHTAPSRYEQPLRQVPLLVYRRQSSIERAQLCNSFMKPRNLRSHLDGTRNWRVNAPAGHKLGPLAAGLDFRRAPRVSQV